MPKYHGKGNISGESHSVRKRYDIILKLNAIRVFEMSVYSCNSFLVTVVFKNSTLFKRIIDKQGVEKRKVPETKPI